MLLDEKNNYLLTDNQSNVLISTLDAAIFKNVKDIFQYVILYWVCPIAIDVQENGNEFTVKPYPWSVDAIITDEIRSGLRITTLQASESEVQSFK